MRSAGHSLAPGRSQKVHGGMQTPWRHSLTVGRFRVCVASLIGVADAKYVVQSPYVRALSSLLTNWLTAELRDRRG